MPERMIRPIAYSRAATRDALADYLLLRSGVHPTDVDPVAERLVSDGRGMLDIAAHMAGYPAGTRGRPRGLSCAQWLGLRHGARGGAH